MSYHKENKADVVGRPQDATRDDIASLTKEASDISGISYVLDADKDTMEKILKG